MQWAAIWHHEAQLLPFPGDVAPDHGLAELTLLFEVTIPLRKARRPLRLWQGSSDAARAIALYQMPDDALRLVHGDIDLCTEADYARAGETVCLRYRACARGRNDVLDLRNMDRGGRLRLRAAYDQPLSLLDALPRDPRFLQVCHVAAIAPFGVEATDLPGLAAGAVLQTPDGPIPVEQLREGMHVLAADGSEMPLRWIRARPHLSLGRHALIRLRAPYFGLEDDICVTPETRLLRRGPAVEYVCGTEAALVEARDLTYSPAAQRDQSVPVRMIYHMMLDDHACILADRCPVETALLSDVVRAEDLGPRPHLSDQDRTPWAPVLDRITAHALVGAEPNARYSRR
jgi:hypothetical protein